jgi:hypothetical protein
VSFPGHGRIEKGGSFDEQKAIDGVRSERAGAHFHVLVVDFLSQR